MVGSMLHAFPIPFKPLFSIYQGLNVNRSYCGFLLVQLLQEIELGWKAWDPTSLYSYIKYYANISA